MSERVVWQPCPGCGASAAVGLAGDEIVEYDCERGCEPTEELLAELRRFRARQRSRGPDT